MHERTRLKEFSFLSEESQASRQVKGGNYFSFFVFVLNQQAGSEVRVCRFHNSLIQQTMKPSTSANMVAHPATNATTRRKIITLRDSDRG